MAYTGPSSTTVNYLANSWNMIYLIGGTHGNFTKLKRYSNVISPDDIVIQYD